MALWVAPVSGVVGGLVRSRRSPVGAEAVASPVRSPFGFEGGLTARLVVAHQSCGKRGGRRRCLDRGLQPKGEKDADEGQQGEEALNHGDGGELDQQVETALGAPASSWFRSRHGSTA